MANGLILSLYPVVCLVALLTSLAHIKVTIYDHDSTANSKKYKTIGP